MGFHGSCHCVGGSESSRWIDAGEKICRTACPGRVDVEDLLGRKSEDGPEGVARLWLIPLIVHDTLGWTR